ncbi:MAG: DUF4139 domain-containing protein [Lewinellaceae bacterium]|nr:DUF4139 domain-containing protein [Lewinellaceae bacterium]
MRTLSILIIFQFFTQILLADNRVSPIISEVTVYRNGAKVSSVATVTIPAGKSEVIFENLSPYFNANSLQVRIKGTATLNAAVFSLNTPGPGPEDPRAPILRDSLILLGDEFVRIRNEKEVLKGENTIITKKMDQIGITGSQPNTTTLTVTELKELSDFYRKRLLEIKTRELELTILERNTNKLYQEIQKILQQLQPNTSNSTGQIAMKIESAGSQKLEITCTYLVTQAGWTPLYDIRSEGIGKPLQLVYKANVRNQSGFDWKEVILHLSTANPLLNNDRPILTPVFVDFRTYNYGQVYNDDQLYKMAPATNMAQTADMARRGQTLEEVVIELPEEALQAESNDEIISNFDLVKPQDILANGLDNIVTVDEQEIPADYEYHAVPKLEQAVFLLAKITDYGKYNLLPGSANIFYLDTYIGQTLVNPNTVSDTLLLSLGRDEQITIKRMQPKDFTGRKRVFNSTVKETYTYEIVIKNNKSLPVNIEILDQIPVSRKKDITVELEEAGGAIHNEDYGKLKWQLEIPPNQNKRLRFTYSIRYPKDKAVGTFKQ